MDALVMEDFVLLKQEQPDAAKHPSPRHLAQFPPD
jgi:hypothetical protein